MNTSCAASALALVATILGVVGCLPPERQLAPDAGGSSAGAGGSIGGEGGSGDAGEAGFALDCSDCGPLEHCSNDLFCVANLVEVTGGYSIDATEVTVKQYASWLATNPSMQDQIAVCSWNSTFEPHPGAAGSSVRKLPRQARDGVDWCDAFAYCKAMGKRLCGKVGGGGNPFESFDSTQSQWFNACSSGGANDYPYGDTYQPQACDGADLDGPAADVGTFAGCASSTAGYTGVYDLSGGLWEWEDSCIDDTAQDDMHDRCRWRGGCGSAPAGQLGCADTLTQGRYQRDGQVGFRCCSP